MTLLINPDTIKLKATNTTICGHVVDVMYVDSFFLQMLIISCNVCESGTSAVLILSRSTLKDSFHYNESHISFNEMLIILKYTVKKSVKIR